MKFRHTVSKVVFGWWEGSCVSKTNSVRAMENTEPKPKFTVHWLDHKTRHRVYEVCRRTTRKGDTDAVEIMATMKWSKTDRPPVVILVRQFRPPLGKDTLEFPAGLIDGLERAETAALRELKEETGYVGKVLAVSDNLSQEPGLTNSNCKFVSISIDGDLPENSKPIAEPDEGEHIHVLTLPLQNLREQLQSYAQKEDCIIDAKLWTFAAALEFKPF